MNYKRIYCDALGLRMGDQLMCEISGQPAQDIHHIHPKGMGGSNRLDRIENLMAITRGRHEMYGDKKQHKHFLFSIHKEFLIQKGVKFDIEWIDAQQQRYADI